MVTTMVMVVRDVIAIVFLAYAAIWALALAVMFFLALVLVVSRGSPAVVRRAFRRAVTAGAPQGSLHGASLATSPAHALAKLSELQAADPDFDAAAFLDGARVAVGAYAMARSAEDDRLLRRVTTPGYWQTPNGKAITDQVAHWRRYAGDRPGATNTGRMVLDVSWREPTVISVALADQGIDRITVRLASVVVGAAQPGWHRIDEATQLDWDFVRPTGQRTDPSAVLLPRTCASCGGPYRSDLDDACPYCHAARADPQSGWRLDRTYLVVDT